MLIGRFGETSGRPYLDGRLSIPRLKFQEDLSFLVDTGADTTMLMPGDGRLLGVDYALLANADTAMRGAGGSFTSYREPAWLRFSDGDQTFGYLVTIRILADDASMKGVPSLLGRDILHRWTMSYSHSRGQLEFEVESADVVLPSSGPSPSPRRQYR